MLIDVNFRLPKPRLQVELTDQLLLSVQDIPLVSRHGAALEVGVNFHHVLPAIEQEVIHVIYRGTSGSQRYMDDFVAEQRPL